MPADDFHRSGIGIGPIISNQAARHATVGQLLQQEADVVAIENRAVADVHAATAPDRDGGRVASYIGDVQPVDRAVLTVPDDDAVVRVGRVRVVITWIAVEIVRSNDDVGGLLDEEIVVKDGSLI